jgi:hypothetical protein
METAFTEIQTLTISTTPEAIGGFTSLLQAGIFVPAVRGVSIGLFLEALPGFTADYINDQVQTIFLNGTATDDMETPLDGDNPVLAISAAMPGLAGAIFRRNSLHAALRTVKKTTESRSAADEITVTLKLFNAIARDRGIQLLEGGVRIKASSLAAFLNNRTPLMASIRKARLSGETIAPARLPEILSAQATLQFTLSI